MTNIIQMENRLKSAPDEALLKEMQRPTGQAPQFLILNELNRRKNTRQEYNKRLQEGQQTTVAEDIVAPSAPPMASPMSQPQSPQMPMQAPPMAPQQVAGLMDDVKKGLRRDNPTDFMTKGIRGIQDLHKQNRDNIQRNRVGSMSPPLPMRMNTGGLATLPGYQNQGLISPAMAAIRQREAELGAPQEASASLEVDYGAFLGPNDMFKPGDNLMLTATAGGSNIDGGPVTLTEEVVVNKDNVGDRVTSPLVGGYKQEIADRASELKKLRESMSGLKPSTDKTIERLGDRAEEIESERGDARSRALIEAGLQIMGAASRPGASIGGPLGALSAAAPAVASYGKSIDSLERRKDSIEAQMTDASNKGDMFKLTQLKNQADLVSQALEGIKTREAIAAKNREIGQGDKRLTQQDAQIKINQRLAKVQEDNFKFSKEKHKDALKAAVNKQLIGTDQTMARNDMLRAIYLEAEDPGEDAGEDRNLRNGIREIELQLQDGTTYKMYKAEGAGKGKDAIDRWKFDNPASAVAFEKLAADQTKIINSLTKEFQKDLTVRNLLRTKRQKLNEQIANRTLAVPENKTKTDFINSEVEKYKKTLPQYKEIERANNLRKLYLRRTAGLRPQSATNTNVNFRVRSAQP